jgi:hypothetical protein
MMTLPYSSAHEGTTFVSAVDLKPGKQFKGNPRLRAKQAVWFFNFHVQVPASPIHDSANDFVRLWGQGRNSDPVSVLQRSLGRKRRRKQNPSEKRQEQSCAHYATP